MKEIRIHGRGGQGSVTAAELLAVAAFKDGKKSQAFPAFGVERRGAPVRAYCRIDKEFVRTRAEIYNPDYLLIQDASLLDVVDVFEGFKPDGIAIINSEKSVKELGLEGKGNIITVPVTKLALEILGRPIVNTAMIGAFAGATGEIKLESIEEAVKERFSGDLGKKNIALVKRVYESTKSR
ncbi:MAG: pyruvate ferredoxin oxidoreductase subunit gamma [Candidatus Hodarchaeota archaeon]